MRHGNLNFLSGPTIESMYVHIISIYIIILIIILCCILSCNYYALYICILSLWNYYLL